MALARSFLRLLQIVLRSNTFGTDLFEAFNSQIDASQTNKADAEAAQLAAETAQGLAEGARDASQSARDASVSAKDTSVAAAGTATTQAGLATTAKDDAVIAKNAAQAAQGLAEAARDSATAAATAAVQAAVSTRNLTSGNVQNGATPGKLKTQSPFDFMVNGTCYNKPPQEDWFDLTGQMALGQNWYRGILLLTDKNGQASLEISADYETASGAINGLPATPANKVIVGTYVAGNAAAPMNWGSALAAQGTIVNGKASN